MGSHLSKSADLGWLQIAGIISLAFAACGATGCPLMGNRSDARLATTDASAVGAGSTSKALDLPSSMSAISGAIFAEKLMYLFPTAKIPLRTQSIRSDYNIVGSPLIYVLDFADPLSAGAFRDIAGAKATSERIFQGEDSLNLKSRASAFANTAIGASIQSIKDSDRSFNALTITQAKILIDILCSDQPLRPATGPSLGNNSDSGPGTLDQITILFQENASLLLGGESFPQDPETRMAFTVARNAWRYPYQSTDPEVQALKTVYTQSSATTRKSNLCKAALLSHQFLIGNPLKGDVINRVSLALTQSFPTMQDVGDYARGQLSLRTFVQRLQSTSEYTRTVREWHGSRLGFGVFENHGLQMSIRDGLFGDIGGSLSQLRYVELSSDFNQAPGTHPEKVISVGVQNEVDPCAPSFDTVAGWNSSRFVAAGGAAPQRNQAFDPRTSMMLWEQFNPASDKFEVLAGWVLRPFLSQYRLASGILATEVDDATLCTEYSADRRWLQCKGRVTLADGTTRRFGITLDDIRFMGRPEDRSRLPIEYYPGPNLIGTPLETVVREVNSNAGASLITPQTGSQYELPAVGQGNRTLRMVRYSPPSIQNPSGRNDQFGTIRNFHTGKNELACNSMNRFIMTCAYLPPDGLPGSLRFMGQSGRGSFTRLSEWLRYEDSPAVYPAWTPTKTWPATYVSRSDAQAFTFAHPDLIRHFRCGQINQSVLAQSGGATTQLDGAVPWGYDPLPAFNSATWNATTNPQIPNSWLAPQTSNSVPVQAGLNSLAVQKYHNYSDNKADGWWRLANESMNQEPYRLVDEAIASKQYSRLVTADHTTVNRALEVLYRTQGYQITTPPPNYTPPASGDLSELVQLEFSSIAPVPRRQINYRASQNGAASTFVGNQDGWRKLARPAAGVLQMPALWRDLTETNPRTAAARIFNRFLCGQPNLYDPLIEGTSALHDSEFARMPQTTQTAQSTALVQDFVDSHLSFGGQLKADCMQCHRSLDPLGMAMFKEYGGITANSGINKNLGRMVAGGINTILGREPWSELKATGFWSTAFGPFGVNVDLDQQGTGAFLGESITGLAGVGSKLSRSRQFYSCAVESDFKNIFGRLPTQIEARRAFKNVVDDFMTSQDYNEMIYRLAEIQEKLEGE